MRKLTLLLVFALPLALHAQMWNGQDTLYGNEWIDFSKTYYKIRIADDGVYRISQPLLAANGLSAVAGSQLRLWHIGQQIPIYTSTEGLFSSTDYVEFWGEKNRDEVDRYLFEDASRDNLNPRYSMFSDTAAYYLSWESSGQGLRYATLPNDLNNLPPKEPYCWQTVEQVYNSAHSKKKLGDEMTFSWFDGNGFATGGNTLNTSTLNLPKVEPSGPAARATARYACGLEEHRQQVVLNDSIFAEDEFYNWKIVERSFSVPQKWLLPNTQIKISSVLGGNDRNALALTRVRYPRQFDFEGASAARFELEASPAARYLEIQGFNIGNGTPFLYDLTEKKRIEAVFENGLLKIKLPASAVTRELLLISPGGAVRMVTALRPVQFRNYAGENADYLVLTHSALLNDGSGNNYVADYAAYRESPAGGGHQVSIADVNELYEQFAYGVRFHPIAVRNFLHFAKKKWPALAHCFIIGKGLDYVNFRNPSTQAQQEGALFFVPTFSTPAADIPFVLSGARLGTPVAAIGRLAVTKPSQIRDYLEKVKNHEQQVALAPQTIEGRAWMKRVIHNSGGQNTENVAIRNYTSEMANILINNRFGAEVHPFYKTSNDPIQLSSYEQMLDLINGGVSIWTIFGHSSAFAVDFDIGSPSVYNNKNRYPFLLVMGCFSGLCSLTQPGIGEQFVLAPDRGAIAYVASVDYSFLDGLHDYAVHYYGRLGGADYGKSVGEALQHTIADLQTTKNTHLLSVLHQNLLQGDPAIRLHALPGPDYLIDNQKVQFDPNPIGLETNTFKMKFDVVNIGQNPGGSLAVKVEQRRPDNSIFLRALDTIEAPPNRRTLEYTLPTAGSQSGFNRFFVTADPNNDLAELPAAAELNNELADASGQRGVDVYFYTDDVQPVFPSPYGIVKNAVVTLRASTLNTGAAPMRYLFEFDTVETFQSSARKSATVEQRGGLLEWSPPVQLADSTVYYWRVARDSLVNGQVVWRTRSFIRLANAPQPGGWNQSHYGQYRNDNFSNLIASDSLRRIDFSNNAANVIMNVAYRHGVRYPGFQNSYYEGFFGDYGFNIRGVGDDGVVVTLSDPKTGRFVVNPKNGPYNHNQQKDYFFFWFKTRDSLQRVKLMDFLSTQIPNDHIVSILAFGRAGAPVGYAPQQWAQDSVSYGKNLFQIFESLGAQRVRELPDYVNSPYPYGLMFRKGNAFTPVQEAIVPNPDSVQTLRTNFLAKWTSGLLETPVIGPVKAWKSLHWRRADFDDPSDQASLEVLAVREGLPDTLLFRLSDTYDTSLVSVSAAHFPQLKLRYDAGDTLLRTLTQPRYLRVLYDGVPEGALNPAAQFDFYRDTLERGETLKTAFAFANVSDAPMDSLLVKFRIEGSASGGTDYYKKYKPLPAGETLIADFQASTLPYSGPQRLLIDVNPNNAQPEQYHFNNVALRDFYVSRDRRNPLLDVTFDGSRILDGDLISPQPVVVITLKDDNRYLALTDTGAFSLTLELPNGVQQRIASSDPTVLFFPADGSQLPQKNLARLEWRPVFTVDGEYRLLVNGRDASGNASAALDWSVSFRVITKSSLSNVLNYPNPFSTSTCFVYTMTGAEPPAHFRIQIMTVSGRVVREITEAEFGPLRAGTHKSDFCWDGKDEYGDQLANGVYLYRIVAKKADGTEFEFFENQAQDSYFKQGFGKMVLMR